VSDFIRLRASLVCHGIFLTAWITGAPAAAQICGNGRCQLAENPCNCPPDCGPQQPEDPALGTCTDGIDNNCDGPRDCLDPACFGDPSCAEPICGDGFCDPGEACVCVSDCPPTPEDPTPPVANCADGMDNDCNGLADCADPQCAPDPACAPAGCGDGVCATPAGENPCTCLSDCGPQMAGEAELPQGCADGIDNDCDGQTDCADLDPFPVGCSGDPACVGPFCGDGVCDAPAENSCTCPSDCGPPEVQEVPGLTCTDGINNDCDGQTDCEDPDCRDDDPICAAVVCGDGVCDAPAENSCACPPDCGPPEFQEFPGLTCTDGINNDCDGQMDCEDPDCRDDPICAGPVCGDGVCATPAGENPCTCTPDCGPSEPEDHPAVCEDGLDNDCDGAIDCADPECAPFPPCLGCNFNGLCEPSLGENPCNCADCAEAENHPIVCEDGLDNDCDGAIDCADPECAGTPTCPPGCNFNGLCEPPLGENPCNCADCAEAENHPIVCEDGLDNDCDGAIDCADPECAGTPTCPPGCNSNGLCEPPLGENPCTCPPDCGQAILEHPSQGNCQDGIDNNCNGLIDCADPDCATDPTCAGPVCGDGVCATPAGENPCTCPADCGPQMAGEAELPQGCTDGIDNDCDGQTDCGDLGPFPVGCSGDPACQSGGCGDGICDGAIGENPCNCADCGPSEPEDHPAVCEDGLDNDCDGAIDCADPECAGTPTCPPGCNFNGLCEPTLGENPCNCADCGPQAGAEPDVPGGCRDTIDNDCDGAVDCGDSDCLSDPACGGFVCGDGSCDIPAGEGPCNCPDDCGLPEAENHPIVCEDGLDNDCDGAIDCADPECAGTPTCPPGCNSNGLCEPPLGENPCTCPPDCGQAILEHPSQGNCQDGIDNNCNGLIDCADPDCATDPTCAGPVCGDGVCATPAGENPCTCPADCGPQMAGEAELPQGCTDGIDNDCDGQTDCGDLGPFPVGCSGDPACQSGGCGDGICDGAIGENPCNCADCAPFGGPEDHPAACEDGVDNDCDGAIDCADSECVGVVPSCPTPCNFDGTCEPPLGENPCNCADCGPQAGAEPDVPGGCRDAIDNDCDGAIDCTDSDCLSDPACGGFVCGDGSCDIPAGEGPCNCPDDCGLPEAENHPIVCEDGLDNDCDGAIDCADPECAGTPTCPPGCNSNGLCEPPLGENPCTCPPDCGQAILEHPSQGNCQDGIDNNCNGLIDCADPDCATDPTCAGPVCGDGVCATPAGENPCTCTPDCGPSEPEDHPAVCEDGLDNDCDGAIDCADPECTPFPPCLGCNFNGLCEPPLGENPCNCPDCGPSEPENHPAVCEDGLDNDCDGAIDCADPECTPFPPCLGCNFNGLCEPSLGENPCNCPDCGPSEPENHPAVCEDGLDNDCDGAIDCADSECLSDPACRPPADLEYRCVIVSTPSLTDRTTILPASMTSAFVGDPITVEFWATDLGTTNTGLVSVYANLDYPESCVSTSAVTSSALFNLFTDGTDDGTTVDDLGGSQLSGGVGVEPEWARIASVDFAASADCPAEFRLLPATAESSAFGRGLVPISDIIYGSCVVDIGGCCCIYNLEDSGGACLVDGGDLSLFAPCWTCGANDACWIANDCPAKDFDCNGFVGGGDLGWFAGVFNLSCDELDATANYPPCRQCDGPIVCPWVDPVCPAPSATATAPASAVEPISPDAEETGALVEMAVKITRERTDQLEIGRFVSPYLGRVEQGELLWAEVWVRDLTLSSRGLTAVFADVSYDPALFTVIAVTPSPVYSLFAETALVSEQGVAGVGGATLEPGWGMGRWVRVAVVELEALTDLTYPAVTVRPREQDAVSGFGRGLVPIDRIQVIDGPSKTKGFRRTQRPRR